MRHSIEDREDENPNSKLGVISVMVKWLRKSETMLKRSQLSLGAGSYPDGDIPRTFEQLKKVAVDEKQKTLTSHRVLLGEPGKRALFALSRQAQNVDNSPVALSRRHGSNSVSRTSNRRASSKGNSSRHSDYYRPSLLVDLYPICVFQFHYASEGQLFHAPPRKFTTVLNVASDLLLAREIIPASYREHILASRERVRRAAERVVLPDAIHAITIDEEERSSDEEVVPHLRQVSDKANSLSRNPDTHSVQSGSN
jgi:hypothetical protein